MDVQIDRGTPESDAQSVPNVITRATCRASVTASRPSHTGTSEENCVQLEARRGAVLVFADQATPDQE
jgi:hypothetical protein